jgi:hypothetical protein
MDLLIKEVKHFYYSVIRVDQSCWSYREVALVGEPLRICWPLTEGKSFYTLY